jgi:predicted N-acyltransferase
MVTTQQLIYQLEEGLLQNLTAQEAEVWYKLMIKTESQTNPSIKYNFLKALETAGIHSPTLLKYKEELVS